MKAPQIKNLQEITPKEADMNQVKVNAGIRKTFHWRKAKWHVVLFFEDSGEQHVVIKQWFRHLTGWYYEVWPVDIISDKLYGTDKSKNR